MALKDCLATALEGGEITRSDHDRLAREFDRARARAAMGSEATADAEAKRALQDLLKAETAHEKRKAKLAISSIKRIAVDLDAHRNPSGQADVASAALFLLEHNGEAKFESVAGRQGAIVGMAHAMMESLLHRFRRSALMGDKKRLNRAQLGNVVREAFGEDSGDAAAKGFAESWERTHEWLRQRFNAAGGAIGKLEKWGLPQRHDARALRARGMNAWREDILPLLDASRMTHPLTGKPVHQAELGGILDEIWENIVTDGWNARNPIRQPFGKGALANQRAEHRFLVFKDADAWLKYQADYGGGSDPFAAMMGHINMLAKDIAAMEVLGPNPGMTVEFLKQAVAKEGALKNAGKPARFAGKGDPLDRVSRYHNRLEAVWGSIRGHLSTPVNGKMAAVLSGTRNLITSSVLGGAALSSVSDIGTSIIARRFAGVGGSAFGGIVKAFTPATRREAVAAGLIHDSAMHVFAQQARYVGTLDGVGNTAWLADRVLTWSGLTPWTQAAKHAFGLGFFHEAANQAGRRYDKLNPLFRSKFAQYGIGAEDWEKIRKAAIHKGETGLTLLRPAEIAAVDPRMAERWLAMVQRETEYAVPTGGHRSRTLLLDQNQPGTVPGEILRSFAQFKSFGAVFAMLHGGRTHQLLMGKETRLAGAAYAGSLLLSSVLFGALATQLKQVAAGKDPRPMTSPEFWGAAFLQGGGIGLYGDFLFADLNRYGGGLPMAIGGPTAERIGDFLNLTVGNAVQLATGDETKFGKELVQFARGNVPGGNIWYTRLAWERMVLDQLQFLVDPDANKAFKRKQRNLQRDYGQGFWWKPGQMAPERALAIGNMSAPPPG